MGYLKFDKTLMNNLEESLSREVLRTNQKGAYHCSTIVDCNTRKYHGLLVMPVPCLDDENHVLLSSFDETVIQHGAEFNLGLHKYAGGHFSPNGHKYIREYNTEIVPRTLYRVGGVILSKEKVFSRTENQIFIRYKLEDAHSATTLRFRPFLAFRSVKQLTHENGSVNQSYEEIPNGIKTCMYEGYPDLYMQFSKSAKFVFEPYWYKGLEYPKEQERGYPYHEDLYVPGYFEVPIKKGETLFFCAGDKQMVTTRMKLLYEMELQLRTPRSSFFNMLKNASEQFLFNPKGDEFYLLAGYPWFKVRARDLFISIPGCTLCIDDRELYEKLMRSALPALMTYIKDGTLDPVIRELDKPDVLLWAVWCVQQYANRIGLAEAVGRYEELVSEIIQFFFEQRHPDIRLMDTGLLYVKGRDKAASWMNSTIEGKPVVCRSGYLVELNALWYNALRFYKEMKGGVEIEAVDKVVRTLDRFFPETFVNKYKYLFDYVDGQYPDWSVRPNMVIAISMTYSPLTRSQKRNVLDVATKELLTPKGLRTLSPKSEGYRPYYVGPQYERDLSYHQGTAWPWLLGPYLSSYLQLNGRSGVSFAERMLISLEEEMSLHCIGTISELFDGNPPFIGRGAISYLMSIASMLRIVDMLRKYNAEEEKEE